jgi:SAM-dependent methyltransferase
VKPYKKLCTEFYDLEPHRDGAESHIFYMQHAQLANGPILEPMCGTGRFLIPMLEQGYDIEGFDASPDMLDALKKKWAQLSDTRPPVWQQKIQDFGKQKWYNLIFVPYGSWGLISNTDDAKKSLSLMYNHLAPGGKFIIEIETVDSVPQPCGIWRRAIHTRTDGSKIAVNSNASFDAVTQMFTATCRYESFTSAGIDAVEHEIFEMYLYRFDEMDALLQAAGFTNIKKYQDYAGTQATDQATHIIVYECTK